LARVSGARSADAPTTTDARTGVAYALSAYLLWGALTAYWKLLADFDAFELIGWRVVTSAVVLVPLVAVRGRLGAVRAALADRAVRLRVLAASGLLTVNWTTYVWCVVHGDVLATALGYFVAPVATMLLGFVVLRERVRPTHRAVLALATASIVVLTVAGRRLPWAALVIAATWSAYGYLKKQVPLGSLESLSFEVVLLVAPALVGLGLAWGRAGSVAHTASGLEWALVLGTGVATAVPLLLFGGGANRIPLSLIGPMQYLVPTINFLLGWLAYDEPLDRPRLLGFGLVWCGLAALLADSVRSARASARIAASSTGRSPWTE
jgi:chloramphenicol-sensitive protein RarD